ncbi:MAG: hypothetical protein F4138_05845 [Acidimicrobiia bacterium]|nr:hypothetical protein [Acidimicrobiia bacterium]MYC57295.1 hypothetical protein [Acidimicrobiia bacterium]MYG94498.1 hypothetical protein [Acidimicrobiia bacterium]MYI30996.1 hypothetical protein [Acidimicrobiia bacterium]
MTTTDLHRITSEEELDAVIEKVLQDAGVEYEDLRRQAALGRFKSEKLRRTWFVIAGLGRD